MTEHNDSLRSDCPSGGWRTVRSPRAPERVYTALGYLMSCAADLARKGKGGEALAMKESIDVLRDFVHTSPIAGPLGVVWLVQRPDEMADRLSDMLKAKAARLRREAELLNARAEAIEEQAQAVWHEGYSPSRRNVAASQE